MTFYLMLIHIILVRFVLLSGHLLGKSCLLAFLCILTICILVISRLSFEEWIWVLIAQFPGHCMLVTLSRLMTSIGEFSTNFYS